uniref:Tubulin domain-containing protein n=1 Tax=Macrostomum lignano TaxID=282301 RepID=A0A1I8FIH4_9PLAT
FWEVIFRRARHRPERRDYHGDSDLQWSASNTWSPGTMDSVRSGPVRQLFRPDNFRISARAAAGNNWAKGHYTEVPSWVTLSLMWCAKESEACDCLQGFQCATRSRGGPAPKSLRVVVEPYNATLSVPQLVESSDETLTASTTRPSEHADLRDLNHLVSAAMSGVTTSFRFPGQLNADLAQAGRESGAVPAAALLHARLRSADQPGRCCDAKNMMAACDPPHGRYLTVAAVFRGRMSMNGKPLLLSALPESLSPAARAEARSPPRTGRQQHGIQELFRRILRAVHRHVQAAQGLPALVHWRRHGRMDVHGGREQHERSDLEYQQYQDATAEEEAFEEDEEEQARVHQQSRCQVRYRSYKDQQRRGRQVIQHFNNRRIVATATRRPGAVEADAVAAAAAARRLLGCFLNVRQPKIAVKPHASRCAALPMQLMLLIELVSELLHRHLLLLLNLRTGLLQDGICQRLQQQVLGGARMVQQLFGRHQVPDNLGDAEGARHGRTLHRVAGADRGAALGVRCCCCCFGGGGGEASLKAPTAEEAAAAAAAAVRARCLASASCRLCSSSPLRVSAVAAPAGSWPIADL